MKIAIDIREAGHEKTGKGWYTYNLVSEILKLDSKNHYVLYTDSETKPFEAGPNTTFKVIKATPWKWHFKVLKDLTTEKVDLFFAPTSYIIPAFAPKTLKVIITVHDLVAFLLPGFNNTKAMVIERLTLRKAVKKAKNIFTVSENTKKDLLKRFHYPSEKIHFTPCAPAELFKRKVTAEDLAKVKEKLKLPDHFILAVGTLEPRKNFSNLIKSFVIIKRKNPQYKLVIVGKKGWKSQNIQETLKQYDLEKEVIFPGYVEDEDLQEVYHLASVFVFPSLYEGFGIPPLEAMACECPVVSSNVSSLPEVVGEAGLLIDPKNAHKIAEAVSSLLVNEQVRNVLIERGKIQAAKFSWQKSAQNALEAFNLLSSP